MAAELPQAAGMPSGGNPASGKPFYSVLYVQVLLAIVLGALVGWLFPVFAINDWVKALGDGFIRLIKMLIAPIIFCTVVSGISHIQDARKVGRVGLKALVYFEVVSSFALLIGLLIGNLVKPGVNFGGKIPDAASVAGFVRQAHEMKSVAPRCFEWVVTNSRWQPEVELSGDEIDHGFEIAC